MFSKSKLASLLSFTGLCLFILGPLCVNSFLLDPRIRGKLKLRSQRIQANLLNVVLNVATVGSTLFLSPIIKKGDIAGAQRQATVPPMMPGVQSFSGYITVNDKFGSNLFFWMFKSLEGDWKTKPLVIWLQGGPGVSSMYGLFSEVGPFQLDKNVKLVKRKYSWCQKYNLMFIDNPVGTGFSFTKQASGYPTTELAIAKDLYSFIVQFYAMFPELKKNPLYITGESYAGKMIPAFSHYIHLRNQENKGKGLIIPLAAVAIGNGFSDPFNMLVYGDYLYQLGLIDRATRYQIRKYEEEGRVAIKSAQWEKAFSIFYDKIFYTFYNETGLAAPYNFVKDVDFDQPIEEYLGKAEVKRALHVGTQRFQFSSDEVWKSMNRAFMQSVKPLIQIF